MSTQELDFFPPLEAMLRQELNEARAENALLTKTLQLARAKLAPNELPELYIAAVLENRARINHWRNVVQAFTETRTTSDPKWVAVKVSALQLITGHLDGLP